VLWTIFIYHVFKNLNFAKKIFNHNEDFRDIKLIIVGMISALIVRLFEGMFSHSLYIFFWYAMAAMSVVILQIANKANENNGIFK